MGVLDGFESTWSNARLTFGEGTPQEGAQYDNSGKLRQLQSNVQSAKPGSGWTGSASDSYGSANEKQARVIGGIADVDQRLRTEIDRSAQVVIGRTAESRFGAAVGVRRGRDGSARGEPRPHAVPHCQQGGRRNRRHPQEVQR